MKKFIISCVLILFIAVGFIYAIYDKGLYLDLHNVNIESQYKIQGKNIKLNNGEDIKIRAVNMTSALPGHTLAEYAPNKNDYLRWIEQISEMGSNAIRVYSLMDSDFYDALYEFNSREKNPIYLIQGIEVSDQANYGSGSGYSSIFKDSLLNDGKKAIDIIHGRKISIKTMFDTDTIYRKDVSKWVIGYVIGSNWDSRMIAYTNNYEIASKNYSGKYIRTADDASPFEALLAEIMDEMMIYESNKYSKQRLMSFFLDSQIDFLEYTDDFTDKYKKYIYLDPENIKITSECKSGFYPTYKVNDYSSEFLNYISETQKNELSKYIDIDELKSSNNAYYNILASYHTTPIVAQYGFSSSRNSTLEQSNPMDEVQQGTSIINTYTQLMNAGWNGVCIEDWQDCWQRRTWNEAYVTLLDRNYLWHDLQAEGQNYGLLSFSPGKEKDKILIDGKMDEWDESNKVHINRDDYELYLKYDTEGAKILIRNEDIENKDLYIPIDIMDDVGSTICNIEKNKIECDRRADFVIRINGKDNSAIYVNDRVNPVRENFLEEVNGENPYFDIPSRSSCNFVIEETVREKKRNINKDENIYHKSYQLFITDTGRLNHGTKDIKDDNYNSLSDFCFGDKFVEISIPWTMLNVADPTQSLVHQDYYSRYGITFKKADKIYIGVGQSGEKIHMGERDFSGIYDDSVTHERLKKSYEILRESWKGNSK